MPNQNHLAEKIEKKYQRQDERKKKKMKISGKSAFKLKKIIAEKGVRE